MLKKIETYELKSKVEAVVLMSGEVHLQNLRQHQLRAVELLRYFDDICKKNNIRYYLIGGSALGAVRHQGFIPWDDDIDVGVPREDYERLEKLMLGTKHPKYQYRGVTGVAGSCGPISYLYEAADSSASKKGLPCVDVHPLDGVSSNPAIRGVQKYFSYLYHLAMRKQAAKKRGEFAFLLSNAYLSFVPDSINRVFLWLGKSMTTAWNYDRSRWIANIFGAAKFNKEVMPRDWMGQPAMLSFEGHQYPSPSMVHEYLTHLYGNYMELPSQEERRPKHVKICSKNPS